MSLAVYRLNAMNTDMYIFGEEQTAAVYVPAVGTGLFRVQLLHRHQ